MEKKVLSEQHRPPPPFASGQCYGMKVGDRYFALARTAQHPASCRCTK